MLLKSRFLTIAASATFVSLIIHGLAFLRQILVAAFFGAGRDLDMYVVAYAVTTYVVFTFSGVFDSIAVSQLSRVRADEGERIARALAAAIFRISLYLAAAASALLLIAMVPAVAIMATGFSADEKTKLVNLGFYFLPWALACLPYYATAAWHKAEWRFNRVFSAEIVVVVVSIVAIALWNDDIRALPLAYAAGYVAGLLVLLAGAGLIRRDRKQATPSIRGVLRNIGELYLAAQSGSVAGVVDRHIQSFVPAGGVAAVSYSGQLITSLSSLLTLREIFVVPLAQQDNRADRFERLICGLVLIAIPLAGVVACFAPEIIKVLFERGRFDAAATALTAEVLRINAFSIIAAVILTPHYRMLQLVDRINFTHLMFGTIGVSCAIFGYVFVVVLQLGVRGVAMMQLASSAAACIVTACLVARCGIVLNWRRIFGFLMFGTAAAGAAFLAAVVAILHLENVWARLTVGGSVYSLTVLIVYLCALSKLRGIIFGNPPIEI